MKKKSRGTTPGDVELPGRKRTWPECRLDWSQWWRHSLWRAIRGAAAEPGESGTHKFAPPHKTRTRAPRRLATRRGGASAVRLVNCQLDEIDRSSPKIARRGEACMWRITMRNHRLSRPSTKEETERATRSKRCHQAINSSSKSLPMDGVRGSVGALHHQFAAEVRRRGRRSESVSVDFGQRSESTPVRIHSRTPPATP